MVRNLQVLGVMLLLLVFLVGPAAASSAGKSLHIFYSGDERGAVTPCG
ncbi:MAG: hypothetical protein JXO49_07685 [Deltaproteobacteria bacterium]|nr:hypothetical protein [Candidatus Anaeroferrophillus wilburensis]MBN2889209.1 hypothetical protein [Deltaproteobacteria bacterium]